MIQAGQACSRAAEATVPIFPSQQSLPVAELVPTHSNESGGRRTWRLRYSMFAVASVCAVQVCAMIESLKITLSVGYFKGIYYVDIDTRKAESTALFSRHWAEEYASGSVGCKEGRGNFMWRPQGFGSNANNMLNAWVRALAVEKWSDLAVITDSDQMKHVECRNESSGVASTGWDCLFTPMPHLCTFSSAVHWTDFMASMNVSSEDQRKAVSLDQDAVRFHPETIVDSLENLDVDHVTALAAMAKHLWSYRTPWLLEDVRSVVPRQANAISTEEIWPVVSVRRVRAWVQAQAKRCWRHTPPRQGRGDRERGGHQTSNSIMGASQPSFLGLHIRRGDKVSHGEMKSIESEDYLSAAAAYLGNGTDRVSVDEIVGIWLASDDPAVLEEVREIAPGYFPNLDNGSVTWVSGGVPQGQIHRVPTRTDQQTYAEFVYMFADLQQLAAADVFVGTFSSNVGRLVVLLREFIGGRPRDSAISLDVETWAPGRRRS